MLQKHIRLALPEEGQDEHCELPADLTDIQQQIDRMTQSSPESQISSSGIEGNPNEFPSSEPQPLNNPIIRDQPETEEAISQHSSQNETVPQPDQETE